MRRVGNPTLLFSMPPILYVILGIVISAGITYLICYYLPQQKIKQKNLQLDVEEERQKAKIEQLNTQRVQSEKEVANLESKKVQASEDLNNLSELTNRLRNDAKKNAETYYNDLVGKLKYKLQKDEEDIQKRYKSFKSEYDYEYSQMLDDYVFAFKQKSENLTAEQDNLVALINELRQKANSIVEVNKRAELEKSQKDFYRIVLPDEDIEEIRRLREVLPYLRDKEPLNKVIYKVYYEKPLMAMIGRVLGPVKKCGIYKITNLKDGKCYVGQSNNIQTRWVQHCKRGVGADPPTNNKLYPILYSIGIENFMFELVEECFPEQLNEREKYYQEVFHAQDYGYSIR